MLKAAKEWEPDGIVIIGDFMDCYSISSHSKDPSRLANFQSEIDDARSGLDDLDCLGARHRVYVAGNHEDRFRRYIADNAPALDGWASIPTALGLSERGWEYVPYKSYTTLGKIYLTHDVGTAGRFAAYRALDDFEHSIVTGHAHRMSYVVEGNATGERKVSAMFGWLGDVDKADYMHRHKMHDWALGFGVGYHETKTGIVHLCPIPIVDYSCVLEGRLYRS